MHRTMTMTAGVLVAATCVVCRAADLDDGFPKGSVANPRRIAEIAARLPMKPEWPLPLTDPYYPLLKTYYKAPLPDCREDAFVNRHAKFWTDYGRRKLMLREFAAAVRKDGDEKALARAIELLEELLVTEHWALFEHDRPEGTWLDLGSTELIRTIAEALVQMKGRLPKDLDRRVRAELERRAFSLYRSIRSTKTTKGSDPGLRGNWWFYCENNWSAFCHCHLTLAVLGIVEDRLDRAAFVEAAERAMWHYLRVIEEDGYCSEGMGYWTYGFGPFMELTEALANATSGLVNLSRLPRAKVGMAFGFSFMLDADHSPNFADGGSERPPGFLLGRGARFWPEFAARIGGKLAARDIFPVGQVYIGRSPEFQIGLKGGHNGEMHNHNDVGSWTLVSHGVEVAGEPGPEKYTDRTFSARRYESNILNSYGHPVPRIDGELQFVGREHAATVVETNFTAQADVVELDLLKAYGPSVQKKLEKLRRRMTFDRAREKIELSDFMVAKVPVPFESVFMTTGDCMIDADGHGVTIETTEKGKTAKIRVSVHARSNCDAQWRIAEERLSNPSHPDPKRLTVTFDKPLTKAGVSWTVCPADADPATGDASDVL